MHKEIVVRKKVFGIVISLIFLTCTLYLYELIELSTFNNHEMSGMIKYLLAIITIILLVIECKKCTTSYKYSIIADKLIINKISNGKEKNVESIKFQDILYIGKESTLPKEINKRKRNRNYLCENFSKGIYICSYKRGQDVYSFKFQPSDCLVNRIKHKI